MDSSSCNNVIDGTKVGDPNIEGERLNLNGSNGDALLVSDKWLFIIDWSYTTTQNVFNHFILGTQHVGTLWIIWFNRIFLISLQCQTPLRGWQSDKLTTLYCILSAEWRFVLIILEDYAVARYRLDWTLLATTMNEELKCETTNSGNDHIEHCN